jgi:hypothetical protein
MLRSHNPEGRGWAVPAGKKGNGGKDAGSAAKKAPAAKTPAAKSSSKGK